MVSFAGYLALNIPAAVSKTFNKGEMLAKVDNTTNLVELQNITKAHISLLCNYNLIGGRLLTAALATCLLTALLLVFALISSLGVKDGDH
jgi:hypothetical protein